MWDALPQLLHATYCAFGFIQPGVIGARTFPCQASNDLEQRQLSCRPKNSGWAGVLLDAGFLQIVPAERRGVY